MIIPGWIYKGMAKERDRTGNHKRRNVMTEPRDKENDEEFCPLPNLASPGWKEEDEEQKGKKS